MLITTAGSPEAMTVAERQRYHAEFLATPNQRQIGAALMGCVRLYGRYLRSVKLDPVADGIAWFRYSL